MGEAIAVHVPRDNVNDESVKLVAWLVADAQPVTSGQVIAEIETSKASADILAPADGILVHRHQAGDEVEVGGLLAHVRSAAEEAAPASSHDRAEETGQLSPAIAAEATNGTLPPALNGASAPSDGVTRPKRPPRIGPKALELMRQHGLDEAAFSDFTLVREDDVRAALGQPVKAKQPATRLSEGAGHAGSGRGSHTPTLQPLATGVPVRLEPLPRAKRIEARYLSSGLHETLPSVVTVACPTRGLRGASLAHPVLAGQTSALIIYETARLLRAFPNFNACHQDGSVAFYEQVNIGFALDVDHGLKVPVIRDADAKSLGELATQLRENILQYLDDELPVSSLAGGTFTITDLSGDSIFSFHPLINQSQSAILGVGGEFFAPGSSEGMFNLILAFDHQLTAGREAARFLNELKRRIAAYESVLTDTPKANGAGEDPYCIECFATSGDLWKLKHHLLQSVGPKGESQYLCTRCASGLS